MNRNRQRDNRLMRDNRGGRSYGIGGDGLLGEGPPSGGPSSMMGGNSLGLRDTQLALAQSLLQQQQLMNSGFGGAGAADFGGLGALAGGMHFLQQQQQQQQQMRLPLGGGSGMGISGMGGMRNDRKRSGGLMRRDNDEKRGRRDSWGRGERDRSHGNNSRSGQDRDRNRRESDKEKKKQVEDYDPAEPTEDDDDGHKGKDGNLYCHVCSVSVYDEESFQRHLNGLKHKARMESIASVHNVRSTQMNFRMKAEEHLRHIERKGGRDPDYFCKICNNDLAIPWEKHRYSNIHKQRLLQVRKGCGWCKVHDFTNFTEVLEHRETDEHKKNAEVYGKKEDEKDDSRQRIKDGKERTKSDKGKEKKEEVEEEEDLTIPEYNAESAVGLDYVIPVTGYFCKLCHKFYNKKSAKATHCQSTMHYEKFKEATEVKIAAREKRREEERLRKEKEAEEEEEEEEAMEEDDGVEIKEEIEDEDKKDNAQDEDEDEQVKQVEEEEGEEEEESGDKDATMEDDVMLEDEAAEEDEEDQLDNEQDLSGDIDSTLADGTVESSSFMYVAGDEAEAQLEQEAEEDKVVGKAGDADADDSMADVVTTELSQTSLNPEEGDDDLDLSVPDEEASQTPVAVATATPVVEEVPEVAPPKATPTRGKGTARRGRGRGRAKK